MEKKEKSEDEKFAEQFVDNVFEKIFENQEEEIVIEIEEESEQKKLEESEIEVCVDETEIDYIENELEYLKSAPLKVILEELKKNDYLIEKGKKKVEKLIKEYIYEKYKDLGFSEDNFDIRIAKLGESIKENFNYVITLKDKGKKKELLKKLVEEEVGHYFVIE
jgi:hypothetical protein